MLKLLCDKCGSSFLPPSWFGRGSHTVQITMLDSEGLPTVFNFDTCPDCTTLAGNTMIGIFAHSQMAIDAAAQAAGAGTGSGTGTSDGSGSGTSSP